MYIYVCIYFASSINATMPYIYILLNIAPWRLILRPGLSPAGLLRLFWACPEAAPGSHEVIWSYP